MKHRIPTFFSGFFAALALAACLTTALAASGAAAVYCALQVRGQLVLLRLNPELRLLLRQAREKVLPLPPPTGLLEEDYQALVQALASDRAALALENRNRLQDMTDYYTLWAHQVKTPIAALGLLLQETGESGPLEVELLKIEQYVEMVLSYLRLDSDSTDYVLRDCQLDEILRQAVRKLAKMLI